MHPALLNKAEEKEAPPVAVRGYAYFREYLFLAVRRRTAGSLARALKVKPENLA